jgi:excisionase family DNA binding protein
MQEQHLSTKQVCLLLGISLSTFYRYCKAGILKPAFFTLGQHRRFSLSYLRQSFNLDDNAVLTVCYSRVSSHDQKHDLITQENKLLNYAQLNNYQNILSITDLGSGLNYKKKGLKQLINLIFSGKVKTLIINHKDRLLRFGSELIFYLCDLFKVNIIIIENNIDKSFEETLSSDVIELMTVFCAKLYGKRSHKNKLVLV